MEPPISVAISGCPARLLSELLSTQRGRPGLADGQTMRRPGDQRGQKKGVEQATILKGHV